MWLPGWLADLLGGVFWFSGWLVVAVGFPGGWLLTVWIDLGARSLFRSF